MPVGSACSLKNVLDQAGVKAGAVQVRFNGMDQPVVPDGPDFMKSISVDHARDGEVMIAYAMNGEQLPLLNGFPLRLVVPGWYATYWIKMLNDIEVLDSPDTNFWMKTAYTIPDTPHADMKPGQTGVPMVPINKLNPRSFITNIKAGATLPVGKPAEARGIAFGGYDGRQGRRLLITTAARPGRPRNSARTKASTASGNGTRSSRPRRRAITR